MGWIIAYPTKDAKGDPLPLPPALAEMNLVCAPPCASAEEYPGEAFDRGLCPRGFNKT